MRSPVAAYAQLFRDRDFFRLFLPLALPIALQGLVSSLTNLGTGLLVGQLGDKAVAGVSLANQVNFVMLLAAFGLGSGTAMFTSQYWGRGDAPGVGRTQGAGLLLSLTVGLLFGGAAALAPETLLGLFSPDPDVVSQGARFMRASALSYPLTAAALSYGLVLRSVGDARAPLLFSGLGLVVQAVSGLPLVFGAGALPALGTEGAGWSLVLARAAEAGGLIVWTQVKRRPNAGWRPLLTFDTAFLRRYLEVAFPVFVSELLWATGISGIKAIYGWMGAEALAATALLDSFNQLFFIVFFGTGNAAAVLIGQAIGRGDRPGADHLARQVALFSPVVGLVGALPLALAAPVLPLLYQVSPEVRHLATGLFLASALLMPGRAFYHDMIVGVLRGGGDTAFSLVMDQSGIWLWALPLGWLCAFVLHWPLIAVYLLISLEEPLKSTLALWRLHTGRWIHDLTAG